MKQIVLKLPLKIDKKVYVIEKEVTKEKRKKERRRRKKERQRIDEVGYDKMTREKQKGRN